MCYVCTCILCVFTSMKWESDLNICTAFEFLIHTKRLIAFFFSGKLYFS